VAAVKDGDVADEHVAAKLEGDGLVAEVLRPVVRARIGSRHAGFAEIIEGFPFQLENDYHHYVIFCESPEIIDELMSFHKNLDTKFEDIAAGKMVIYWQVLKGNTTDSVFAKLLAKSKYKTSTTTRNINTLKKIV